MKLLTTGFDLETNIFLVENDFRCFPSEYRGLPTGIFLTINRCPDMIHRNLSGMFLNPGRRGFHLQGGHQAGIAGPDPGRFMDRLPSSRK